MKSKSTAGRTSWSSSGGDASDAGQSGGSSLGTVVGGQHLSHTSGHTSACADSRRAATAAFLAAGTKAERAVAAATLARLLTKPAAEANATEPSGESEAQNTALFADAFNMQQRVINELKQRLMDSGC